MKTSTKYVRIAFDNAGGATLWNRIFAHHYDDGRQLAADVICLLAGGDVRQWDGNDADLAQAMHTQNLTGYEAIYTLPELAGLLANGLVTVHGDDADSEVTVHDGSRLGGRRLSGYTEARFFRAVSAR